MAGSRCSRRQCGQVQRAESVIDGVSQSLKRSRVVLPHFSHETCSTRLSSLSGAGNDNLGLQ